jgi:hypothetical protein
MGNENGEELKVRNENKEKYYMLANPFTASPARRGFTSHVSRLTFHVSRFTIQHDLNFQK